MKKHCNVGDIVKINNKYYQVHQSKFICDGCAFKDEDCFNINRPSCRNKIFVPYVLPQNAIIIEGNNQKQNIMNTISAELALVAEPQAQIEIDFEKLKKNQNTSTIMGIPVVVDKVMYNINGETVIGISGVMNVRGLKIRGVWDAFGNILDFKKSGFIFGWDNHLNKILENITPQMFSLVIAKKLDE